jgi:predicted Fe-S protein YdhL (DUF1289 family)
MSVKELRPKLDPEMCSICGRRLLQGENVNWYVAPDSSRRVVCDLCVPRAERVRWVRERAGEEIVQLRPARGERAGLVRRIADFFGAAEPGEEEDFAQGSGRPEGEQPRRQRAGRRREEEAAPPPIAPPRDVAAVPTGPESRLERGLELFNLSQFPRTIAGLTRSLGDPKVAAANSPEGSSVDIWVGWDLAWYSYRVSLGDPAEPVEQSGRGNDVDELAGVVKNWNAGADGFGRLYLADGALGSDPDERHNPPS